MDFDQVAKQFSQFYYNAFDNDRRSLAPLYREISMLSFEGKQFVGVNKIIEQLTNLPFQKVSHQIDTIDAQISNPELGFILVMITGQLLVSGVLQDWADRGRVFQLVPEGPHSYFVLNDIFRLNYG